MPGFRAASISSCSPGARASPVAEAVAGDLRKIGVRASVERATVNVFQTKRGEGKAQTQVTLWDNGGGAPDIDNDDAVLLRAELAQLHRRQAARAMDRRGRA